MECRRAGFRDAHRWSIAKLNWVAGLLHREKCNDALLCSLAARDPNKVMDLMKEIETEPVEISDDWEPPSLERIKRNMERYAAKS